MKDDSMPFSCAFLELLAQPLAWRETPNDKGRHEGHVSTARDFAKTVEQERETIDFRDVVCFPVLFAGVCCQVGQLSPLDDPSFL